MVCDCENTVLIMLHLLRNSYTWKILDCNGLFNTGKLFLLMLGGWWKNIIH